MKAEVWSRGDPEGGWDEPLASSLESSLKSVRIMMRERNYLGGTVGA